MNRQEAERVYDAGREAVIAQLLAFAAHIHTLEQSVARLSLNSSNSSRPPSSDPPGMKKSKKKAKSTRKQGAQPGHKGKNRKLLPAEEMDIIHELFPDSCHHCGNPFAETPLNSCAKPARHQVFDLPEIVPFKEEYRCHSVRCSCGHTTAAVLPEQVAHSHFGPRTHAAIAYLAAMHRLTRRGIAEIMQSLFGLTISTGAICNAAARVADACGPMVKTVKRYVASALTLNIDETGWKYQGKNHFLWAFVAPEAVLFQVSSGRSAKVLRDVLGQTFAGVIISDDHSAYASYHKNGLRQLCWAHIIRKLKALEEDRSSPHAHCFGKNMRREIEAIFTLWHTFLSSGGSSAQLMLDALPMRERMHDYCVIFSKSCDPRVQTRTKRLLDNWHHLFTFLEHDGVQPTNNAAERAIRPAVQWRKICFGSQSPIGEQFTGHLLTVVRTCQLHKVNAFDVLARLVVDFFSAKQPLPLLPMALPV